MQLSTSTLIRMIGAFSLLMFISSQVNAQNWSDLGNMYSVDNIQRTPSDYLGKNAAGVSMAVSKKVDISMSTTK